MSLPHLSFFNDYAPDYDWWFSSISVFGGQVIFTITKNLCFLLMIFTTEIGLFLLLNHQGNNLSVLLLIKSGYYIVPNLSTTLFKIKMIFSNSGRGTLSKVLFEFTFPYNTVWNILSKMSALDQNCRECRDKVCTFMKYRQSYQRGSFIS